MPKYAFYAVKIGRVPGIYSTWGKCDEQVKGFSGAVYKKFDTADEAQQYISETRGISTTSVPSAPRRVAVSPQPGPLSKLLPLSASPSDHQGEEGWISIYTDGACRGNGQKDAVAGLGVWLGHSHPRNISERVPGAQTNNRAELIAIIRALEMTPLQQKLVIKTDSTYCRDCIEKWLPGWRNKDFRTANGQPVKNQLLILYLSELLSAKPARTFRFEKVLAHSGIAGNEGADTLAGNGCLLPWREEYPDEWDPGKVPQLPLPPSNSGPEITKSHIITNQGHLGSYPPLPNSTVTADLYPFTADDLLSDDDLVAELSSQ